MIKFETATRINEAMTHVFKALVEGEDYDCFYDLLEVYNAITEDVANSCIDDTEEYLEVINRLTKAECKYRGW